MLAFSFLNFGFYTCLTLFIIVCLFLMLLILIQKGRGGGLASAFGGAGGNTAFGSKTGDVLTWATSIVFGVFLALAVVMNLISNQMDKQHRDDLNRAAMIMPSQPPSSPAGLPGLPGSGATPDVEVPAQPETSAPAETPTPAAPAPAPAEKK